jgi:hypothetical protein
MSRSAGRDRRGASHDKFATQSVSADALVCQIAQHPSFDAMREMD